MGKEGQFSSATRWPEKHNEMSWSADGLTSLVDSDQCRFSFQGIHPDLMGRLPFSQSSLYFSFILIMISTYPIPVHVPIYHIA
jgi:hypothetical protein